MTARTHEIARSLQMAGLAQPTKLVELAEWIDKYATERVCARLLSLRRRRKARMNLDRMEGSDT